MTKIRRELGIDSDDWEMFLSDYQTLIENTECNNYDEFRDLCDEIKAKYLTFNEFKELLDEINND